MLVLGKIESLEIEAREFISTVSQGQAAAERERGCRRSWKSRLRISCWAVREHLPDCHKTFCGALSTAVNFPYSSLWVLVLLLDRLQKRSNFCSQNKKEKDGEL